MCVQGVEQINVMSFWAIAGLSLNLEISLLCLSEVLKLSQDELKVVQYTETVSDLRLFKKMQGEQHCYVQWDL